MTTAKGIFYLVPLCTLGCPRTRTGGGSQDHDAEPQDESATDKPLEPRAEETDEPATNEPQKPDAEETDEPPTNESQEPGTEPADGQTTDGPQIPESGS